MVKRLVVIDAPAPVTRREIDDVTALLWFLEDLHVGFAPQRVSVSDREMLAVVPESERLGAALGLRPAPGRAGHRSQRRGA